MLCVQVAELVDGRDAGLVKVFLPGGGRRAGLSLGMPCPYAYGSLSSHRGLGLSGSYPSWWVSVARSELATQRCLKTEWPQSRSGLQEAVPLLRVQAGPSKSCCRRCATTVPVLVRGLPSIYLVQLGQLAGSSEYTVANEVSMRCEARVQVVQYQSVVTRSSWIVKMPTVLLLACTE